MKNSKSEKTVTTLQFVYVTIMLCFPFFMLYAGIQFIKKETLTLTEKSFFIAMLLYVFCDALKELFLLANRVSKKFKKREQTKKSTSTEKRNKIGF